MGLAVRDFILAPMIWDNGTTEEILPKLSVGIAPVIPIEKISSVITLECDFVKSLDIDGFNVNMGFEYTFRNFISGRFGRHNGNYTFGVGLKYKKFNLDYALVTHSELKNSNKISAGLTF